MRDFRRALRPALTLIFLGALTTSELEAKAQVGAVAVEAQLYAPCCFNGTLDTHDSELARTLRGEIEQRVAAGEPTESIRRDFVSRYGDRVLATQSDRPFRMMTILFVVTASISFLALARRMRGWSRSARPDPERRARSSSGPSPAEDPFDARLADELARFQE